MVGGNQQMIAKWLIGWAVASFVVSSGLTSAVLVIGSNVIPRLTGALPLFVVALGLTLLVWALVNLITTLISAAAVRSLDRRSLRDDGWRFTSSRKSAASFDNGGSAEASDDLPVDS